MTVSYGANAGVKFLGDGRSDGEMLGRATTDPVAFYGTTPIVQPSGTSQSAVATTAITTLATTPTFTDIAIAVNSLISRQSAAVTLVNQLRSDLVSLGLLKGSA